MGFSEKRGAYSPRRMDASHSAMSFMQALAAHLRSGSISADREEHIDFARRERPPCSRAAEQGDELAPVHCPVPPVLPIERIAHLRTAGACCTAGFQSGLCRLWVH